MHPNKSFGIDHPLIAVHDIERLRNLLIKIGFNMTPIGRHPWGTSTSLAIFNDCLLEIMGMYDVSLIDVKPAGDFHFGRHVHEHLLEREGVALTALHSTNAIKDANIARESGWEVSGHLEFGRDVTLPNGNTDRTKTSLALMPDSQFPRLSFFLCQQHRRELVEVSEWMNHSNGVHGINGVAIKATTSQQVALRSKLEALYGPADDLPSGFLLHTPNGSITVQTPEQLHETFSALPDVVVQDEQAAIVGMDFQIRDVSKFQEKVENAGLSYSMQNNYLQLVDTDLLGNMIFRFSAASE